MKTNYTWFTWCNVCNLRRNSRFRSSVFPEPNELHMRHLFALTPDILTPHPLLQHRYTHQCVNNLQYVEIHYAQNEAVENDVWYTPRFCVPCNFRGRYLSRHHDIFDRMLYLTLIFGELHYDNLVALISSDVLMVDGENSSNGAN